MIKVYGLQTCDTTKAAIRWMKQRGISYTMHDYKLKGISEGHLTQWLKQIPPEKLLNKKSTTWRALTAGEQEKANSLSGVVQLMMANPTLMKRPLVEWTDGTITVGFDEKLFDAKKNN